MMMMKETIFCTTLLFASGLLLYYFTQYTAIFHVASSIHMLVSLPSHFREEQRKALFGRWFKSIQSFEKYFRFFFKDTKKKKNEV